jgi:oligopeptide/dipeptide ABC transporter ATP-binding protein
MGFGMLSTLAYGGDHTAVAVPPPSVIGTGLPEGSRPLPSSVTAAAPQATATSRPSASQVILDVRELKTYFYTYDGVVRALDGVTFKIRRGETVGLVGETGCGKSVTAFSITKLIPDPPGRIMDGSIYFRGANLLWGLKEEASFKPVRQTNRVKVKRRFRRVKAAQARMVSVRGGGISMIFQEPSSALNPVFSISDQVSETLLLHRGEEMLQGLLGATPKDPAVEPAIAALAEAARSKDLTRLRAASKSFGEAVHLTSMGTQAFYIFRGNIEDPEVGVEELRNAMKRLHLSSLQRSYVQRELKRIKYSDELARIYFEEMRQSKLLSGEARSVRAARSGLRLRTFYYGLWGIRGRSRRPVREEGFWRTVGLLEGVSIANPVQVARGYPHELSGGMVQRVMIAMALSCEPELLIADEPTTALDVTIQAQILNIMRELKTRIGTAILLITHDLGVIAEVVDRVCVMYAGNVVEVGPVREVFQHPLHPYTQGLLNSIPRLDDPTKRLESIPGSVPNLISPPSGCRFHPRCPHAMPICKENRPPTTVEGPQHSVACYLFNGPVSQE